MSTTLDVAAAAAATGLPMITIATCGNTRKYEQSFNALRAEAESHNRALLEATATAAPVSAAPAAAPAGRLSSQTNHVTPPRVLFRMVYLHYDAARRRMVLSTNAHAQGGDATSPRGSSSHPSSSSSSYSRRSRDSGSGSGSGRSSSRAVSTQTPPTPPPLGETHRGRSQPLPRPTRASAEAVRPHMSRPHSATRPDPQQGGVPTGARANSAGGRSRPRGGALQPQAVDVVLHKVTSFASDHATRALVRFVRTARAARAAERHTPRATPGSRPQESGTGGGGGEPRPPLVLLDALDKVRLLATRCMLYKLLDSGGRDGRGVALIPRTFRWERPTRPGSVPNVTPVGLSSFIVLSSAEERGKCRANGPAGEKWWVAKPDEGTGPSFTHHLVLWKSAEAEPGIPPAVRAVLPAEASTFVVQEYYLHALPVVLKVYVLGGAVFVKASPTVKLLAMIEEQLAAERERAARLGSSSAGDGSDLEVPIFMDSQNKDMFTATGLQTATVSSSYPVSLALTPDPSACAFTASPSGPASEPGPGRNTAAERGPPSPAPAHGSATGPGAGERAVPLPPHEPTRMVVPNEMWEAFLAPGTPAHAHLVRLAQSLSSRESGLGLNLYGFDVLLLPRHLAHSYQRAAYPRGFGYAEGPWPTAPLPTTPGSASEVPLIIPARGTVFAYTPDDIFDVETGAPRRLLMDSVPVIIDVNYFPGYKGVDTANAAMLSLAYTSFWSSDAGSSAEGPRSSADGEGGREEKKRHSDCVMA